MADDRDIDQVRAAGIYGVDTAHAVPVCYQDRYTLSQDKVIQDQNEPDHAYPLEGFLDS